MNEERLFNLADLIQKVRDARMYSAHFDSIVTYKVNKLSELCGRLPSDNEAFFIETRKSFTAFAFIVYLMRYAGRIDHLYVATYSTNARVINALVRYHEKGLLGSIHFHVSETLKFRMPQVFANLKKLQADGVLRLTCGWTHKKVAAVQCPLGHFVIEGSGNYGENALEEQYVFIKSKKVYEFRSRSDDMGGRRAT